MKESPSVSNVFSPSNGLDSYFDDMSMAGKSVHRISRLSHLNYLVLWSRVFMVNCCGSKTYSSNCVAEPDCIAGSHGGDVVNHPVKLELVLKLTLQAGGTACGTTCWQTNKPRKIYFCT